MTAPAELSGAVCRSRGKGPEVCHRFAGHKGRHVGFDPNDPKSPVVAWEETWKLTFEVLKADETEQLAKLAGRYQEGAEDTVESLTWDGKP